MKKSLTILTLLAAGLLPAQSDQKAADNAPPAATKKEPAKADAAKKPAAPSAQPLSIPKDAVQNPDGTYSYTDQAGKKWKYVSTPFGVRRSEDGATAPIATPFGPAAAKPVQWTKATDNGETVKFERQTPFGPVVVEKKKSDLTAEERAFLDSQTAKSK
jgi:hypothetical protein